MILQPYDISTIVSLARDIDVICNVVIFTPFVYSAVFGSSIGADYLPSLELPAEALLVAYAFLGIVTWHGWRRGGVDLTTCLAIAAFWGINAFLLGIYWISENYQYAATFGLMVGAVSTPLLGALVRAALQRKRNPRLQLLLRAFLGQRRFAERPPRLAPGWRSLWHYLEFTGALLVALCWWALVSDFLDRNPIGRIVMDGTLQYGLTMPFFIYAFKCKRLAEQRRALSIEEVTDRDRRAPILFLRSFSDDDIHVPRSLILLGPMPLECPAIDPRFWGRLVRFEEVLAKALWEMGPVVAIGAPSEEIPQLGGIRSYYADTSWQSNVTELMRRARLVLVIPSGSRSVQWEIGTLRQLGLLAKTIFLLPPGAVTTQTERWKSVMCAIATNGGAEPLPGFDPTVRAIVVGDNVGVALRSTELDEMVLTLVAKGAADSALRGHFG